MNHLRTRLSPVLAIGCFALVCLPQTAAASSVLIDLETDINGDDIVHGQIIDDEFFPPLSVNAVNLSSGPNLAIIFDSTVPYDPALPLGVGNEGAADPDLVGPPPQTGLRQWDAGNLAPDTELGNLLILAEHPAFGDPDADGDGIIDAFPDDEGSRPAGFITFNFETPVDSVGFDLVDIEGTEEILDNAGYVAAFYMGSTLVGQVGFGDFIDPLSPFYDSTVVYGNHSANRIQPITAAQLGGTEFDQVKFSLGGSGAITNILFTMPESGGEGVVPEPSSWALLALGSLGLVGYRLRRKKRAKSN